KLIDLLKFHVIAGRVSGGDALNAGEAETLQGSLLRFEIQAGQVKVNASTVRSVDLDAGNGIIHVIDTVLIPPTA
ncbi:MAG: fasciclin domain-containing protein, partial [Verrucomicrobiales bacterium]|nr:fasciclin domain-containing protein [Verrucomicrobiales bacterium]